MGEGLGAFLAHPAFQHLSAYLEVPGVEQARARTPSEIQKLRDLHARWTACLTPSDSSQTRADSCQTPDGCDDRPRRRMTA